MTLADGFGLLFLGMCLTVLGPLLLNYIYNKYKEKENEENDN